VVITRGQIEEMLSHLRATFPDEGCGVLASQGGRVTKVYPIANVSQSPVVYRMDPIAQLEALEEIDEKGWALGAIFHSHTRTRAYPSKTDVELAFYPDALQIIISLANQDRPDIRAFRIESGTIAEEPLEISEA
jgi:proteasome lid subunit RPN8/RPN11